MNLHDLEAIADPYARFMQCTKFIRLLIKTEEVATKLRDQALLELREEGSPHRQSLRALAKQLNISHQRLYQLEQKAREELQNERGTGT